MKKKLTVLSTTIMMGLGSAFFIPSAKAETLKAIEANISKTNGEISSLQDELLKLSEQINRVNQAIQDNQNLMKQTEEKTTEYQKQVDNLNEEINEINKRIEKRNEILKNRARSVQETGGSVNYIDVLLGANSFNDFISRVNAVVTIVQADKDIVDDHKKDLETIKEKKSEIQKKLSELNETKIELKGMQEQILEQKAQNDELKNELKEKQQNKISEKEQLLQQKQKALTPEKEEKNNNTVSSKNTIINLPVMVSNSANGDINTVLTAGNKYIGNSVYVFGGGRTSYDVANGRFDCSGFVHWAFAQAGVNIGSSTSSLAYEGTKVSVSEMRPGDLVFFDTYKKDGHVGIYLGNGQFIGSQSSTGVAIANMGSGYWARAFKGHVRRVM